MTTEMLSGFLTNVIQSDFAVALDDSFDESINMVVVNCRVTSNSLNNDDILRAPKTDTLIASGMPLPCGSFPSVVASIIAKHFSASSQMMDTF